MIFRDFLLMTTLALTAFSFILIPIYWYHYSILNFLWFSDISLFITIIALWLKSPLLISMAAIALLPIEIIWNTDLVLSVITGYSIFGIVDYMYDPQYSLFLRSLSLFHIFLPIIWIWCLIKWGYKRQAPKYALIFVTVILFLTYILSNPKDNINWVFMPTLQNWTISQPLWLILQIICILILAIWPLHEIFKRLFIR
jgi:hypothetical protein